MHCRVCWNYLNISLLTLIEPCSKPLSILSWFKTPALEPNYSPKKLLDSRPDPEAAVSVKRVPQGV